MGNFTLLALSMLAALVGSVARKYYMDKNSSGMRGVFLCNAVGSAVSAIILLAWGGFGKASLFTLLFGAAFGLVTALQSISNLAALAIGPMSYTTVIVSFSTVITALSGKLFFGEDIVLIQIIGIVLMLASFVFAVEKSNDERKANLRWLVICIVAFIFSGGIGLMQKIHQTSDSKGELNAFLIVAFAVSTAVSFAIAAYLSTRGANAQKEQTRSLKINKSAIFMAVIMVINGATIAVNHKLNLYLSGVIDSATFFPLVNGGGLVLSAVAAIILFKERPTRRQWCGILLGVISVVLLCNPFG